MEREEQWERRHRIQSSLTHSHSDLCPTPVQSEIVGDRSQCHFSATTTNTILTEKEMIVAVSKQGVKAKAA